MKLNKWVVGSIIIIIFLAACFIGIKAAKKIYRHIKKPKLYDARPLIKQLNGSSITPDYKIFVASSLDRIFKDGRTTLKPTFTTSAILSAARHEYESFQIVINAPKHDLTGVYIKTSPLKNKQTGEVFASENITWRSVGYVQTITPYYPTKFVGLWPDPLIPVKSVDVKAQTVQPLWVTVYVPANTLAGDYEGSIEVGIMGYEPQHIPVKLKVYNFTLPKESQLKTAFDFYGHITKIRYPQGKNEADEAWQARLNDLNDKFIVSMLKYRMNPVLNLDPTSQGELSNVDRYRALGLNNFSIGKRGGTFNNNWPEDEVSIEELLDTYRTYGESLKLNGLLEFNYIYTWDEGDMGNPRVSKIASMIHRAYPGLKNMVCYHGLWDPDSMPGWGKDIDIWTFQIDDYNEERFNKLKALGMEMWMYISGPAGTTSPNLAMDFDSIDYRIISWVCWKFDIKGFLYWCVNWWPKVDPFTNAANSDWAQNGNGLLFYPGTDGPWASLRVEVFRDGMEDYEYIQLLIKKLQALRHSPNYERNKTFFDDSKALLTMDDSIVASMTKFTRDGETLKNRRNAIAQKIEELLK